MNDERKAGPLGSHPNGKIDPEDAGALDIRIASDYEHGVIVMDLGAMWIAFPPDMARTLAAGLIEKAQQIEEKGHARNPVQ
jgi:hypothetical protein